MASNLVVQKNRKKEKKRELRAMGTLKKETATGRVIGDTSFNLQKKVEGRRSSFGSNRGIRTGRTVKGGPHGGIKSKKRFVKSRPVGPRERKLYDSGKKNRGRKSSRVGRSFGKRGKGRKSWDLHNKKTEEKRPGQLYEKKGKRGIARYEKRWGRG